MNLLLITFSFPPAGGVGVLRALSLAKYLPENGVRVDVLTAGNAPSVGRDTLLLQDIPEAVTVHRSWTLDLPFALRKGIKKIVSGNGSGKVIAGPATPGKEGGSLLKRAIGNLLLPDPQVGWLPFAFPAAKRIIRSRKIDAVLITVPPFSSVRLVTMLRRAFPTLPIILDFRDEWLATTINLVSFNNNERARSIAYKTEAEAVRDATAVVAVTESARQVLIERYSNENSAKFQHVSNGFEARSSHRSQSVLPSRDQVILTYTGSVYGSSEPSSFVEAVLALPPDLRKRLHVRFIGHIETAAYRQMILRLGDTVELNGFLPRSEALRALDDTDYLLLITHDPINISAKFYDYLGGSKPILAAIHPEGAVRRVLEETSAGQWADVNDPSAIRQMLEEVLRDGVPGKFSPDQEQIARYDRRSLAKQYAILLRSCVGV